MTRKAIDDGLRELIARHNDLETFQPGGNPCWGWGAQASGGYDEPCVDCGLPASMIHVAGVRLCWRCGFWRHMSWCPHAADLAAT